MEEDLSELLIKKEKELKQISKLRLLQLEDQVKTKSQIIEDLNQKLENMQEDFNYNVKLIDDRDAELLELEHKFESLRKSTKQKDAEISELRAYLATAENQLKNENSKVRTQELILLESRDKLREELAELKWKKEDEVRKLTKSIEESERSYERMIRQKDEESEAFRVLISQKFEKIMEDYEKNFNNEKDLLLNEISEQNNKIQSLTKNRNDLQEQVQKILSENKAEELEKYYTEEINKLEESISDTNLQLSKLLDHTKHLSQQSELLKSQLESETQYNLNQKSFYEKELNKLKNSHQEELNFLKESYEIQIQRLNSTYTSQISRLQERISQAEEESEKAYIHSQQLRDKSLQNEKKTSSEIEKVEEIYKKDLKNSEETIRLLRLEITAKDSELKSLQENLGAWKARTDQYSEESKRLRIAVQETEVQVQTLRSELNSVKEDRAYNTEALVHKLKEDYERKIKELAQDLDSARARVNANYNKNIGRNQLEFAQAEKLFKKSDEFPKLWSEDYGPASSVKSNDILNRNLQQENDDLKNIIEQMRKDMEFISQNALKLNEDPEKYKQLSSKLKNELVRVTAERDQLLEISSELRAELRMFNNNPQYQERDLIAKISHVQEDFSPKRFKQAYFEDNPEAKYSGQIIPNYEDFQEILSEPPEREEKEKDRDKNNPRRVLPAVNSNRETASQKEVHEKFRSNLKKTKKPVGRNYNIKD